MGFRCEVGWGGLWYRRRENMRFEHGRGSPSRMDLGLGGEQGADLGGLLVKFKTRHWVHFPDPFKR